ncbi:MAG: cupin domain-containing protein [Candidatus Brockarchaeota archaeon]|nr:cupin domain-containing protein [Candidatus Brockarchaeota archaeon]
MDGAVKRASIYGIVKAGRTNFLDGTFDVGPLFEGGVHFYEPGEVSHAGEERHVHEDHYEIFVGLQGKGKIEVEGESYPFGVGDVYLVEPGESHHVTADKEDPVALVWLGARRPGRQKSGRA